MKTATLIKDYLPGFNGHAQLWKLSEPLSGTTWDEDNATEYEYVIVVASVPFSRPETYIFGSNEQGGIMDWGELEGSFRGGLAHPGKAITEAGYEIS